MVITDKALALLRSYATRLEDWVFSLHPVQDTIYALLGGTVLGLVAVIVLSYFPGDPIDYGTMADGSDLPEQMQMGEDAVIDTQPTLIEDTSRTSTSAAVQPAPGSHSSNGNEVDAAKMAAKFRNSRAAKLLGLTEEQVAAAVQEANTELREGANYVPPARARKASSGKSTLAVSVDLVVYGCLLSALVYYLNKDYGSAASQFLQGAFPREMRALGLGAD